MSISPINKLFVATVVSAIFVGCNPTRPLYLNDRGDLSYYLERSSQIEYPDVEIESLDEVTLAPRPITVIDPDFNSFIDLTLEECVGIALKNSKVLRGYGTPNLQAGTVAPGVDNLINGPTAAGTFYDVAIRQSEPGFIGTPGQLTNPAAVLSNTALDVNQGVEAALADFDTQFTAGAFWNINDEPRNADPDSGLVADILNPEVFQQDTVSWQAEFAKKTANGTQLFFRNTNQWIQNNNPLVSDIPPGLQALDSFYRTAIEVEIRQPLLRGRGAFIQRAPIVISRISTDQVIANLEAQVQNMVTNVEIRYWDLQCAFRALEASKEGRNAALETWRIVYDQFEKGGDANIQQVAQASGQYHLFDGQVFTAYNTLLSMESDLRWLLGLATTDGRIIRPTDEAIAAPVEFDWHTTLQEALTYRPELRQQRWEVKKRELAFQVSKNSLLPELNVTGLYRWLGLGNRFGTGESGQLNFPDPSSGAINDLFGGEFQEFSLGIDYRLPIGLRREMANVRNAQLKLAQDTARIQDMELDATREISEAVRALDHNRRLLQSSFNRWKDAQIEKEHFDKVVGAGFETLDVALEAQQRKTQVAVAYYTALCEYNKVIALIHRRKGTILAYNGIAFEEGPWPGKAYIDAQEHARRRGASRPLNYGWTRPQVVSQGNLTPGAVETGAGFGTGNGEVIWQPGSEVESYEFDNSVEFFDSPAERVEGYGVGYQPQTSNRHNNVRQNVQRTASNDGSRPIVPSFIEQANYEQSIPIGAAPATKPIPDPRRKIAGSKAGISQRSATNPPQVRPAINWEQFGFSENSGQNPTHQTRAKIKN